MAQEVGGSSPLMHPVREAVILRFTPKFCIGILGYFVAFWGELVCILIARRISRFFLNNTGQ